MVVTEYASWVDYYNNDKFANSLKQFVLENIFCNGINIFHFDKNSLNLTANNLYSFKIDQSVVYFIKVEIWL